MKNLRLSIRQIVLMGMLVGITIVLDVVFKFYQQANGGSINLAMVGLVLIGLSFTWWKTWLATSIVFGILSAILDGYIAYYLFDYALALSGFMVISFFRESILNRQGWKSFLLLVMTFIIAFIWRLGMHVISGVIYFEVDWLGSWIYNITYLLPSFFITFMVIVALYFSNLPLVIKKLTT